MGHDVAPVAGGVSDGQKNRLVFNFRLFKGVASPGTPVNRVIGMLQEIGAFLLRQLVSEIIPFLFGHDSISPPCKSVDCGMRLEKTAKGVKRKDRRWEGMERPGRFGILQSPVVAPT